MRYAIVRGGYKKGTRALVTRNGRVSIFRKKILAQRRLKEYLGTGLRPRIIKLRKGE